MTTYGRDSLDLLKLPGRTTGHGNADVDNLPPRAPLAERVDLDAVAAWTAANERARRAYRFGLTSRGRRP